MTFITFYPVIFMYVYYVYVRIHIHPIFFPANIFGGGGGGSQIIGGRFIYSFQLCLFKSKWGCFFPKAEI